MSMAAAIEAPAEQTRHIESTAAEIRGHASAIDSFSTQCDALCLKSGTHLADAIPTLTAVSAQFGMLSETLRAGEMFAANWDLTLLAGDVRAISGGLNEESRCLKALIQSNQILAQQIANVMDDVRFLVAMVSNAKVELASVLDDQGEGLGSFGNALADIASKADRTLRDYKATHARLLSQLLKTAEFHGEFETTQKQKLGQVAEELDLSIVTFNEQYKAIEKATGDIGTKSQSIGMLIGRSVMALQVGDRTRQRIEHARDALGIAAAKLRDGTRSPTRHCHEAWGVAARICHLQRLQIEDAARDFQVDIAECHSHLQKIAAGVAGLIGHESLGTNGSSINFLGELEPKLKLAETLITEFHTSRATVDEFAGTVASRFEDLDRLAASVAAMVIDMTIVGTNAIVKFYRLGQRGAALSIIAQHLRSHALKVADGIKVLTPTMRDVRADAADFTRALAVQDSARMANLAKRMSQIVKTFSETGLTTAAALQTLEKEAAGVHALMVKAGTTLDVIADFHASFIDVADGVGLLAEDFDRYGPPIEAAEDEALDRLLKPHYTMASERTLHADYFAQRPAGTSVDRGSPPGRFVARALSAWVESPKR